MNELAYIASYTVLVLVLGIYLGVFITYHQLHNFWERNYSYRLKVRRNDPAQTVYFTEEAWKATKGEDE